MQKPWTRTSQIWSVGHFFLHFFVFLVLIMHGDGKSKYVVEKDKRKRMDWGREENANGGRRTGK
jgi:hypothetical protein